MNELMIVLSGNSWLYFMTNQVTVDKAFDKFCEACEICGINIDNLDIEQMELRNAEGGILDIGAEG